MVIALAGENRHQVKSELQKEIAEFSRQHGELAVERFDAAETEAEQILHAAVNTSLLSPDKLVVIEDFETNKTLVDRTEELLSTVPESTAVIIVIGKLDKRATYGKLLKRETDFREFSLLKGVDLFRWLVEQAKERGGKISSSDAQYLIERVGADQNLLASEIDKLILHDVDIDRRSIDLLTEPAPSSTVFNLLDAGFGGQSERAMKLYEEQRRQQVEPLAIVGMIGWQLHVLALVKTAKDKSAPTIAKEAGMHPFVVQKTQNLARRIGGAKLKRLVKRAVELEVEIKSRAMNADDAVKHFILSLSTS